MEREILTSAEVHSQTVDEERKPKLQGKGGMKLDREALVGEIKRLYPDDDAPIFYRSCKDLRKLVSPQTMSDILTVAQEAGVIPIPCQIREGKSDRSRVFHPQTEIIRAISYLYWHQVEGGGGYTTLARKLRQKRKERDRLTVKEAAKRLEIPMTVFKRLVEAGEFSLGDENLDESVKRLGKSSLVRRRIVNQAVLVQDSVIKAVEKWKEDQSRPKNTTLEWFIRHRDKYATVSEIVRDKDVSLHPNRNEIKVLALILAKAGIRVFRFERNKASYWVIEKEDYNLAKMILKKSPQAQELKTPKVKQVCGPKVELLPNTTECFDRQQYLPVLSVVLKPLGMNVGPGLSVRDIFGPDSPVSVFRYRHSCVIPVKQKELAIAHVRARMKILGV